MNSGFIITIAILLAFIIYSFYNFRKMKKMPLIKSSDKIIELTGSNFDHRIKEGIILIDFWAEWCMPCKMMAPVLNDLAEEIPENTGIGKLNVEHHQSIAAKYNIRNIPTLILFKNGKEVERIVGVKSKDFLLKKINSIV